MDKSPGLRMDLSIIALLALILVPSEVSAAEQEWNLGLVKSGGGSIWNHLFGRTFDTKPPWAAEAPGAAEARFGLGLDLFSVHQESLRITFMEQTIHERDLLSGREDSRVLRTDPGLLNRKFDLSLDLTGAGIQPAIPLPSVGLPRALRLYPTLFFQAAAADVSLDFQDRNRPGDSSSLNGQGPLFGAGLDLTTSLCHACPWFTGASYSFQKVTSLAVDRSPTFSPPGFEVLENDVRLNWDVQEASTRVGYVFFGNRVVSYLGVSHRWTDLKIEDDLRYRDLFQEAETSLASRMLLESEMTLALAGVEARLGPRTFSRMETSVGDGDWGFLFRVIYLPTREPPSIPDQQANSIAAQIERIRIEYVNEVNGLPEVVKLAIVNALLDRTESKLLAVLPLPDFAALRASVREEFRKVRERLVQGTAAQGIPGTAAMYSPSRFVRAAVNMNRSMPAKPVAALLAPESGKTDDLSALNSILVLINRLKKIFEDGSIVIKVCVKTVPQGADVRLNPLGYDGRGQRATTNSNGTVILRRGLYAYRIKLDGYTTVLCSLDNSEECDPLDLLTWDDPYIECKLRKSKPQESCKALEKPTGWRCEADER